MLSVEQQGKQNPSQYFFFYFLIFFLFGGKNVRILFQTHPNKENKYSFVSSIAQIVY